MVLYHTALVSIINNSHHPLTFIHGNAMVEMPSPPTTTSSDHVEGSELFTMQVKMCFLRKAPAALINTGNILTVKLLRRTSPKANCFPPCYEGIGNIRVTQWQVRRKRRNHELALG